MNHVTETPSLGKALADVFDAVLSPDIPRCVHLIHTPAQPSVIQSWDLRLQCRPCVGHLDLVDIGDGAAPCDLCGTQVEQPDMLPYASQWATYVVRLRVCRPCLRRETGLGLV